jgi:hypothetical protein
MLLMNVALSAQAVTRDFRSVSLLTDEVSGKGMNVMKLAHLYQDTKALALEQYGLMFVTGWIFVGWIGVAASRARAVHPAFPYDSRRAMWNCVIPGLQWYSPFVIVYNLVRTATGKTVEEERKFDAGILLWAVAWTLGSLLSHAANGFVRPPSRMADLAVAANLQFVSDLLLVVAAALGIVAVVRTTGLWERPVHVPAAVIAPPVFEAQP